MKELFPFEFKKVNIPIKRMPITAVNIPKILLLFIVSLNKKYDAIAITMGWTALVIVAINPFVYIREEK